ncbi:hypothetical protein ACETRX_35675, partial [Labrys portucalensis]
MIREGFERLAPISFVHAFDPVYFADANPAQAGKTSAELYQYWLFTGLKAKVPGNAAEHLKLHGLALLEYPAGFDWRAYGSRPGVTPKHRWDLLYHLTVNDAIPPHEIPLGPSGGRDFLLALAGALKVRNPDRAASLYAFLDRKSPLGPVERERWADCLAAREKWEEALPLYRQAIDAGSIQVQTAVKAIEAALKLR